MTASTATRPDDQVVLTTVDDRSDSPARADRGGSLPLAVAAVAAPLLLAVGVAFHPDDAAGAASLLPQLAADPLRWILVHLVEPFAWLLLGVVMLLALPRLAPQRGRRLVAAGAVLGMIGFASIAFIVYGHGETYLFMSQTDVAPAQYDALYEKFQTGMPLAAIPSLLGKVGLLLAGIGLFRARTLPRWAAVVMAVSPFLMADVSQFPLPVGLAVFFGPMLAFLVPVARVVARTGGPALPTGR